MRYHRVEFKTTSSKLQISCVKVSNRKAKFCDFENNNYSEAYK